MRIIYFFLFFDEIIYRYGIRFERCRSFFYFFCFLVVWFFCLGIILVINFLFIFLGVWGGILYLYNVKEFDNILKEFYSNFKI